MAKFKNRGGVIWDFNPADPRTIARVENGELRPIEEVDVSHVSETKDVSVADERASGSIPVAVDPVKPDKDQDEGRFWTEEETLEKLRSDYKEKFGKKVPNPYMNKTDWIAKKLA